MALLAGLPLGIFSARKAILCAVAFIFVLFLFFQQTGNLSVPPSWVSKAGLPPFGHDSSVVTTASDLPLPEAYNIPPPPPDEWCERAYGVPFLREYRDNRRSHCDPATSESKVECFSIGISTKNSETFCVINSVLVRQDPAVEKPLVFQCNLLDEEAQQSPNGVEMPGLWGMREHMGDTGLAYLLTTFFDQANGTNAIATPERAALAKCAKKPKSRDYTILIKRDHLRGSHPWHSLMEIYSYVQTMDILQITPGEDGKTPLLSSDDLANAQVVIMDDGKDNFLFDLWNLIAKKPVIRLDDLRKSPEPLCLDNVVLPIPGGANTMWAGDWRQRNCTHAPLLEVFAKRIMDSYGVVPVSRQTDTPLVVTYIVRHTHRRLRDSDAYLDHLREKFPKVKIQAIDFKEHSLKEQIRIITETDILVGVHGAGLTWQMFLPPESSVVELLPYDFWHRGFRNMAKLLGHRYFSIHSSEGSIDENGWQKTKEVILEEDRFAAVVEAAIHSMYHRGLRADDIA